MPGSKCSVSWSTSPPDSQISICRRTSRSIPFAAKLNEFMFFSSVRVRSSSEPSGRTDTLTSNAQRALLHLRVGDAELDHRLPQQLQEPLRLLGRADVGLGHDLDERRAAAVEVDERAVRAVDPALGAADVDRLRRVLLEVRALDPDHGVAVGGPAP